MDLLYYYQIYIHTFKNLSTKHRADQLQNTITFVVERYKNSPKISYNAAVLLAPLPVLVSPLIGFASMATMCPFTSLTCITGPTKCFLPQRKYQTAEIVVNPANTTLA